VMTWSLRRRIDVARFTIENNPSGAQRLRITITLNSKARDARKNT
jgi:hypothetical protein